MRLIDADKLKPDYKPALPLDMGLPYLMQYVSMYQIDHAPTIEAEPVKRGRWEEYTDRYNAPMARCTACGESTLYGVTYDLKGIRHAMRYCPQCGAKMEG